MPGVEGVDESEWWDDRVRDGGRSLVLEWVLVDVVRLSEPDVGVVGEWGEKRAS